MAHLECEEDAEDTADQNGPTEEEGEGDSGLERMGDEDITSDAVGNGDKSKPEMGFPVPDRENLDQMEGATKHQDESDEGSHGRCGDELITQGKEAEQDHGDTTGNRPPAGDRRDGYLGNGGSVVSIHRTFFIGSYPPPDKEHLLTIFHGVSSSYLVEIRLLFQLAPCPSSQTRRSRRG